MRYKAIVSYDGTNYAGWQIQDNGLSVQQVIQQALSKITNQQIQITAAGRTDSGVHAYNQVFHFDTEKEFKDIAHSINSQLPQDIYVKEVIQVSDGFHARFDAIKKEYLYKINVGEYDPLLVNRTYQIQKKLDVELMKDASNVFVGTHDFTSFNATTKQEVENQVRSIESINFSIENDILTISVIGDGFLRHMVRMIVGTLIQIGLNKLTKQEVIDILNQQSKTACHYNAQACGLYLNKIWYK